MRTSYVLPYFPTCSISYAWMVLDYDMWCNKKNPRGILIELVQKINKSIFMYVGWIGYLPTYPTKLSTYLDKTYLGQILT
jgi:hypothetical protein